MASVASGNGSSGSPIARQELARRRTRPTGAGSKRRVHAPSGATSRRGHSEATCDSAERADTRCRTEGRGGTGFPETISDSGMLTAGPDSGWTTQSVSVHATQIPSRSVMAGPPDGPTSPGSTRRTTTRCPTTCGPSRCLPKSRDSLPEPMSGILGCGRISAFRPQEELVTYVIAQPCVDLKDRACVDECPVDCIYEGKRMLYIHPDECVDCGACEPVCPVEAIFYEDDTPEQWKDYYTANVHFFDDLGSPGGAAKMGEIDKDHPFIEALPPQEQEAH
jgi:NAD-dependent dihydropyrimidine dehydrogenase PreA subunit